jgi:hypothetical protein
MIIMIIGIRRRVEDKEAIERPGRRKKRTRRSPCAGAR